MRVPADRFEKTADSANNLPRAVNAPPTAETDELLPSIDDENDDATDADFTGPEPGWNCGTRQNTMYPVDLSTMTIEEARLHDLKIRLLRP